MCNYEHAFSHDVRPGSLVQTINVLLRTLRHVDVNKRHAFVCELDVVHVFLLESGVEVLRIPADATLRFSRRTEDRFLMSGDWSITTLSITPEVDESPHPEFIAGVFTHVLWFCRYLLTSLIALVSRDGRDLVIL